MPSNIKVIHHRVEYSDIPKDAAIVVFTYRTGMHANEMDKFVTEKYGNNAAELYKEFSAWEDEEDMGKHIVIKLLTNKDNIPLCLVYVNQDSKLPLTSAMDEATSCVASMDELKEYDLWCLNAQDNHGDTAQGEVVVSWTKMEGPTKVINFAVGKHYPTSIHENTNPAVLTLPFKR